MDINWYGQSCFKIKGKTATVVIDPFNPDFTGLKFPKDLDAQVVLSSHNHNDHNNTKDVGGKPLIITGPGEYEVAGVSIIGIATFHDTAMGEEKGRNTVYHIFMDGINIVHLGDLGQDLTEEQINLLDSNTDILMIPVGNVSTIDAEVAGKVVAKLEPKIVIPMHYQIPGLKFNLEPVDNFLKEMASESAEPIAKLTITKDKLPAEMQVVVLE